MRVIRAAVATGLAAGIIALASAPLEDGIEAFKHGRYTEALRVLGPLARTNERARVYFALSQAAAGQCGAAMTVLSAEAKSTDVELARLSGLAAARCYASAGKTGEGLAMAEQLKARFPNDADVLYVAAETEMKAFNDTTFQMFQRTASSYRVHELSARIFEVQNRFGDAIAEYRKAIEMKPDAPDLHFRLGRAILLESHSGDALQAAAQAFRDELRLSPEDSGCEFQLGQIAQVQGQSADARQHFERALQLSPDFVSAMLGLATVYSREGSGEKAISLLARAVELQPDNEAAHYALLTAYRNAGEMDKAREQKTILDRLQKPPEGEFSEFLKKLGDGQPKQQ